MASRKRTRKTQVSRLMTIFFQWVGAQGGCSLNRRGEFDVVGSYAEHYRRAVLYGEQQDANVRVRLTIEAGAFEAEHEKSRRERVRDGGRPGQARGTGDP